MTIRTNGVVRVVLSAFAVLCSCSSSSRSDASGAPDAPLDPLVCAPVFAAEFEPPAALGSLVWREPPVPFARPPGSQVYTVVWLPEDYNTDSVYPLNPGEDLVFRMREMVGVDVGAVGPMALYVLVEGRPTEVSVEGVVGTRVSIDLAAGGGLAEFEITVPATALAPGLSNIDVLLFFTLDGRLSLQNGPTFSVANGSLAPQPYEDSLAFERGVFVPDAPARAFRTSREHPERGELYFSRWVPFVGALEDPTDMILRLQPSAPWSACPGTSERVAVLAFRDTNPVPLGDADRLFAELQAGEQKVHRFSLPLWPDTSPHHFAVVAVTGVGVPARTVGGGQAPSHIVNILNQLWWGDWPTDSE